MGAWWVLVPALCHLGQLEFINTVDTSHNLARDEEASFHDAVNQRGHEDLVDRVALPPPPLPSVLPLKCRQSPPRASPTPQNSFSKPCFVLATPLQQCWIWSVLRRPTLHSRLRT